MDDESDFSVRIKSMLRRAGLGEVPAPVLACVGALCVALVVFAAVHFWPSGAAHDEFETTGGTQTQAQMQDAGASASPAQGTQQLQASSAEAGGASLAVDVEGAVRKPGVYELAGGARIVDAVDAAGGFAANAARTSVNLAQKAEDGMQVYVATKREAKAASGAGGVSGTGQTGSAGGASGAGSGASAAGGSSSGGASDKVNINTASAEELQKLSGIGPSLSQRIIDYRESKGPFKSIEGLKEVSGIGDTRFASIKDSVCI